jgi:type I restriction-modification system DNA methylase subunit
MIDLNNAYRNLEIKTQGLYEESGVVRKTVAVIGALKIILLNKDNYSINVDKDWYSVSGKKTEVIETIKFIYNQTGVNLFNDQGVLKFINSVEMDVYHTTIDEISKALFKNDVLDYVKQYRDTANQGGKRYDFNTPDNVASIPINILNIEEKSTIIDSFNGESGIFTNLVSQLGENRTKQIQYYGQDIDYDKYEIGQLIVFLLTGNGDNIKFGDSITNPAFVEGDKLQKFDYAISSPPFGISMDEQIIERDIYNKFHYGVPKRVRMNSDYIIVQNILATINHKGKAAILLPIGALFRGGSEERIRKNMINDDIIEAIIKLPSNIFSNTGIVTCWIIFNKDKPQERKQKIQYIDLSDYKEDVNRRLETVSIEGVRLATKLYNEMKTSDISNFVSLEKISENNYDLNAFDFLKVEKLYSRFGKIDMVELSKVAKIRRGLQLTKSRLDSANKSEDRTHHMISLGNIENGKIQLDDSDLIKPEERWKDLYEVETGDIIITSKGSLFKVAIVDNSTKNAIVSANLFIIRTNKNKYMPEILKYFLESEIGGELLEGIKKGSIIKSISNKDLEGFLIPNIPIAVQEEATKLIYESQKRYEEAIKKAKEEQQEEEKQIVRMLKLDI